MPCCPFVETKSNWRHFQRLWLRYRKVVGFLLLYFLLPSLSLFVCCCSDRVKVFKIWKTRKGLLKNFLTSLCLLLDLDECATNSHICDVNAVCQNTAGSHTCSCKAGYTGNGKTCYGKLENERENASYGKVCRFSLQLSYFKIILSLILPSKKTCTWNLYGTFWEPVLLYFLSPLLSIFVCCCSDQVKVFKIK